MNEWSNQNNYITKQNNILGASNNMLSNTFGNGNTMMGAGYTPHKELNSREHSEFGNYDFTPRGPGSNATPQQQQGYDPQLLPTPRQPNSVMSTRSNTKGLPSTRQFPHTVQNSTANQLSGNLGVQMDLAMQMPPYQAGLQFSAQQQPNYPPNNQNVIQTTLANTQSMGGPTMGYPDQGSYARRQPPVIINQFNNNYSHQHGNVPSNNEATSGYRNNQAFQPRQWCNENRNSFNGTIGDEVTVTTKRNNKVNSQNEQSQSYSQLQQTMASNQAAKLAGTSTGKKLTKSRTFQQHLPLVINSLIPTGKLSIEETKKLHMNATAANSSTDEDSDQSESEDSMDLQFEKSRTQSLIPSPNEKRNVNRIEKETKALSEEIMEEDNKIHAIRRELRERETRNLRFNLSEITVPQTPVKQRSKSVPSRVQSVKKDFPVMSDKRWRKYS
ncbi:MAG: hypothetical protein ACPG2Y_02810, partial [Acholeplasmataceae bacterium]